MMGDLLIDGLGIHNYCGAGTTSQAADASGGETTLVYECPH